MNIMTRMPVLDQEQDLAFTLSCSAVADDALRVHSFTALEADMAHKTDAVTWWNRTGRQYGAKAPEVRRWMLDSNKYYLELNSINRSQGAILGKTQRYLPPLN